MNSPSNTQEQEEAQAIISDLPFMVQWYDTNLQRVRYSRFSSEDAAISRIEFLQARQYVCDIKLTTITKEF